jgi:hypothetical protein
MTLGAGDRRLKSGINAIFSKAKQFITGFGELFQLGNLGFTPSLVAI